MESTTAKSSFESSFKTLSKEIHDMLISIEKNPVETDNFHNILQKINQLQELLNDSKTFLPAYNMKKNSDEIKELTKYYEQLHEKIQPKKKFTFGKQPTTSAVKAKVEDKFEPIKESKVYKADCGFKNRSNENHLILEEDETFMKDVALDELTNCIVLICGTPSTVRATSLTMVNVYVCAKTSIYIENCKECTFICGSQQLRIHDTVDTKFYMYVTSSAIMENSKKLQFAPISFNTSLILKKAFEMADFDLSKNNWKIVNDFDWLSSDPSPNWCEIPEQERKQPYEDNMLLYLFPKLLNKGGTIFSFN